MGNRMLIWWVPSHLNRPPTKPAEHKMHHWKKCSKRAKNLLWQSYSLRQQQLFLSLTPMFRVRQTTSFSFKPAKAYTFTNATLSFRVMILSIGNKYAPATPSRLHWHEPVANAGIAALNKDHSTSISSARSESFINLVDMLPEKIFRTALSNKVSHFIL